MYFGKNIADQTGDEMDKKRVFISFDHDNDGLLYVIRCHVSLELAQKCSRLLLID
jgi:hypothetical protein